MKCLNAAQLSHFLTFPRLFVIPAKAGRSDSRVVGTTRSETRIENLVVYKSQPPFVFSPISPSNLTINGIQTGPRLLIMRIINYINSGLLRNWIPRSSRGMTEGEGWIPAINKSPLAPFC